VYPKNPGQKSFGGLLTLKKLKKEYKGGTNRRRFRNIGASYYLFDGVIATEVGMDSLRTRLRPNEEGL